MLTMQPIPFQIPSHRPSKLDFTISKLVRGLHSLKYCLCDEAEFKILFGRRCPTKIAIGGVKIEFSGREITKGNWCTIYSAISYRNCRLERRDCKDYTYYAPINNTYTSDPSREGEIILWHGTGRLPAVKLTDVINDFTKRLNQIIEELPRLKPLREPFPWRPYPKKLGPLYIFCDKLDTKGILSAQQAGKTSYTVRGCCLLKLDEVWPAKSYTWCGVGKITSDTKRAELSNNHMVHGDDMAVFRFKPDGIDEMFVLNGDACCINCYTRSRVPLSNYAFEYKTPHIIAARGIRADELELCEVK